MGKNRVSADLFEKLVWTRSSVGLEHLTTNQEVTGSTPVESAILQNNRKIHSITPLRFQVSGE